MTRSIPEKTLEHWCSFHLNYRFRSHLQIWWPTFGAEIDALRIPGVSGKRVWVELKTVEWNPVASRHDLSIDLRQLDAYGAQTVPDYYAFPVPPWSGVIGDATSVAWLGALPKSLLAYQTRSREKWFADWMFVVQGHVLRRSLASQIAAYRSSGTGEMLRIAEVSSGKLIWVRAGLRGVAPIHWKVFWNLMATCGSALYPAQFVVPKNPAHAPPDGPSSGPPPVTGTSAGDNDPPSSEPPILRSDLVARLRLAASEANAKKGGISQGVDLYVPGVNDTYRIQPVDGDDIAGGFIWDSSRALVLLEARGLAL